jgi:hypothetical protein
MHGCFLSSYVCYKVQGRRRQVLMSEDGAELMKEDGRRRRTVGLLDRTEQIEGFWKVSEGS